ncbi:small integral membrane protein 4 [Callorhinchus milii]|nr:small integral membrane protein 4 [Callorhinchus milii]
MLSPRLRQWLRRVPGSRPLGEYRFLPGFFVLGAAMEWVMINIRIGPETFYDVYRRKRSEREYLGRVEAAGERPPE